jgi:hypothetical protein
MGRSRAYLMLAELVEWWVSKAWWPVVVGADDRAEWLALAEQLRAAAQASSGPIDSRYLASYTAPALTAGETLEAAGRWWDLMASAIRPDWYDTQTGPHGEPLTMSEKVKVVYHVVRLARKFRLIDPSPVWSVTLERELYQWSKLAGDSFQHWGSEGAVYDPNAQTPWSMPGK